MSENKFFMLDWTLTPSESDVKDIVLRRTSCGFWGQYSSLQDLLLQKGVTVTNLLKFLEEYPELMNSQIVNTDFVNADFVDTVFALGPWAKPVV